MAHIVLINNSAEALELFTSILQPDGHQISTFNESIAVENKIAQENPDLILLDVVMPERSGFEIMRNLKRNTDTKNIPVILVNSTLDKIDMRWGLRQGAAAYLSKPFTPQSVLAIVDQYS